MPAQTVIKLRRSTAAQWVTANPVLGSGEPGFESDTNKLKLGDGSSTWTALSYSSGGGGVAISDTAPIDTEATPLWWDTSDGTLYIFYDNFWVQAVTGVVGPQGATGAAGKFTTLDTPPANPEIGDGWFDSTNARFFIYYDSYWVEAATNFKGAVGAVGAVGATGATGTNGTNGTNGDPAFHPFLVGF